MANKSLFSTTTGGTVKDADTMAYKEDGASGDPTRNHLFSVMKTFFQGLLPSRITQNESDISDNVTDILTNDGRLTTLETYNQTAESDELSFSDDTINPIQVKKLSNDVLFATAYWPETPKQGTAISLTFPSGSLVIKDGTATSISLTTATYSNFVITGKIINFRINNVGAFATLNTGPLVVEANGTGGKLTIT